jgi:NAD(P)H-hydrate epimerase
VSTLPDWLTALPDAETMRGVDRWAIDVQGVESLELMERAGAAVARAAEELRSDGPVAVICGKGNNGGDGLVAARLLRHAGREVSVVCLASPEDTSGDARINLDRLPGRSPVRPDGTAWEPAGAAAGGAAAAGAWGAGAEVIVDALLGTGFAGEPRGEVADAIGAINRAGVPVVSVDVPSGVDASSGEISGEAVRASVTVTFHAGKPGLWIFPGKAHAGHVRVIDIGVPRGAPMEAAVGLMGAGLLAALPVRDASWTKFKSGQVIVAGGSPGLTGAPAMAARASMRAGAGYVTVCVPISLQAVLASGHTPEMMTRGLPEDEDGALTPAGVEVVLKATERGGALALGPGLGRTDAAADLARALAARALVPMVLDADGLNALAGRLGDLASRTAPTVLTPHAGELGRLLERDSAEIQRARLSSVREAAAAAGAVVVLKGDDTLVADPSGRVAVSPGASPALATAGTGDVLTGIVAALLAQGLDVFTAAAAGVWLHAGAGREAAARLGAVEGVIATDVIESIPAVRAGAGASGVRSDA